jgi:hypothetical protein
VAGLTEPCPQRAADAGVEENPQPSATSIASSVSWAMTAWA